MSELRNLRHLYSLLDIAELGSITKAAEAANLSQSALTQGLNKIEETLKASLFERTASGMFLTSAGEVFKARLERALEHLRSFDAELQKKQRGKNSGKFHKRVSVCQLRAVIATVEHGSFSHAATSMGIAQPTVHRAVRDVEGLCNQQLFIRSPSGVDSTPIARRMALMSSLAFSELEQGIIEVQELVGKMTGKLIIGSLPLARTKLIPESVSELLKRYPQVQVSIVDGPYDELLHSLLHSRIDMIVGALRNPPPVKEITQEHLFDAPLSVIVRAGHPLLKRRQIDVEYLTTLDRKAPKEGTPARERFTNIFLNQGLEPPKQVIECSSSVAVRGLLLVNDRAALLSTTQMQPEIDANLLAPLPINLKASRPIGLTLRKGWKATAVQSHYLRILTDLAKAS
ncbi:MAG: LysR family transcriptional regulator [Pseudohongiella sp.]|nr:LysR family transcriptional regulator [Pseudohongiella sp.]